MKKKLHFKFDYLKPVKRIATTFAALYLVATTLTLNAQQAHTYGLWKDISEYNVTSRAERVIVPQKYRTLSLNLEGLKNYLNTAPKENPLIRSSFVIELPTPDGTVSRFKIAEAPIMEAALAAKYLDIKTYVGQGIDDATATIRMDITEFGFHAQILSANGASYIDPYSRSTSTEYISYKKTDMVADKQKFHCELGDEALAPTSVNLHAPTINTIAGTLLTYRLAISTTKEYSTFCGGTKPKVMAAIVTTINRVVGVYEKELDIRLVLINNTDNLICLTASDNNFTNNNGSTLLKENQTFVDTKIGNSNYDIGHIFSTGGGGVAYRPCVCKSSNKAGGVTGSSKPVGDPFDIDYVSHEMGHQFGGSHTFNSSLGSCKSNIATTAAYEPGSGITIMAYAGICGADDMDKHSIPYFSTKSFDEIVTNVTSGISTCGVSTATGNKAPVISSRAATYSVPFKTPFKLTGTGSDPDGDPITYSWEQFDLGAQGNWDKPTGNAPIFVPIIPTLSGVRSFPKLENVLANIDSKGELKPSYARTLHFRLTVRDNKPAGGGVTYQADAATINVINTTTPFAILTPNTKVTWEGGSKQTVTWDVAKTNTAPISTDKVTISLSTDGGKSFALVIAQDVPNTGSYSFTVPDEPTTAARLQIEAVGNVFYDINDADFIIAKSSGVKENNLSDKDISIYPNPGNGVFNVGLNDAFAGQVQLTVYNLLGQTVKTVTTDKSSASQLISFSLETENTGVYFVTVKSLQGSITKRIIKL